MSETLEHFPQPFRDLRLSSPIAVLHCSYCMPGEAFGRDVAFVAREELLSDEEIARVCGVFVSRSTAMAPKIEMSYIDG